MMEIESCYSEAGVKRQLQVAADSAARVQGYVDHFSGRRYLGDRVGTVAISDSQAAYEARLKDAWKSPDMVVRTAQPTTVNDSQAAYEARIVKAYLGDASPKEEWIIDRLGQKRKPKRGEVLQDGERLEIKFLSFDGAPR